jgi:hypothetical protein
VKAAVHQIDPSGNQGVTAETIAARIRVWKDSRLGALALRCRVLHNGHPLPDAEVKFEPETFLAPNVRTTIEKTGKDGVAAFTKLNSSQGSAATALGPGFYRIEITKRGVDIPAQYNTKTTLGLEIAMDADWTTQFDGKAIEFDLKY